MNELPFVSVIVLNYNGKGYLHTCLSSLCNLNYPAQLYEILLVDNGSEDGSVDYVKKHFPRVKVIESSVNLGFAGGNNLGIGKATGDYVALLNNDTAVEQDWLAELVKQCMGDTSVGASTSKMLFMHRFLPVQIETTTFCPRKEGQGSDSRHLGVKVGAVTVNDIDVTKQVQFLDGFFSAENCGDQKFRWTGAKAQAGIPILNATNPDRPVTIGLDMAGQVEKECALRTATCSEKKIVGTEFKTYELKMALDTNKRGGNFINNAGSTIFSDGSGADRGFLEQDKGQFEQAEEVFSACGASILMKRAMLEDVGLFDDDFFMYYEDTDLAWRARLRGWRFMYTPKSVVRHVHCGSGEEWSPLFTFHVERNRLFMLAKNASTGLFLRHWVGFYLRLCADTLSTFKGKLVGPVEPAKLSNYRLRLKVGKSLARSLPLLMRKRWRIQGNRKLHPGQVEQWMVPR